MQHLKCFFVAFKQSLFRKIRLNFLFSYNTIYL